MKNKITHYEFKIKTHDNKNFEEHFTLPEKISSNEEKFIKEVIPFMYNYLETKIPLYSKEKEFKIFHDWNSKVLYDKIQFYIVFNNSNIYWKAELRPIYFEEFYKLKNYFS